MHVKTSRNLKKRRESFNILFYFIKKFIINHIYIFIFGRIDLYTKQSAFKNLKREKRF